MPNDFLQALSPSSRSATRPPGPAVATAQSELAFFFEARVEVDREAWIDFEATHSGNGVQRVVELLEEAGLTLRHSAVFEDDGNSFFFYNIWELGPDAGMLARAERKLADKVLWADFIKLLDRTEDKDISYALTFATQPDLPPGFNINSSQYLRIEYDVFASGISELQARLEADLASTGKRLGWMLGNTYVQHTGLEGRVIQIWLVPGTLRAAQAKRETDHFPWMAPLRNGQSLFKGMSQKLLSRSAFDKDPRLNNPFNTKALTARPALALNGSADGTG
jgi:hypothetical protein